MSDCHTYDLSMRRKVSLKMLRAVKNFQVVSALRLLEANAIDIDVTDSDGNTMLHWAAATRNKQLFRILLDKGANTHLRNQHDHSISDIVRRPNLLMHNTGDNKEN
jgi:ankyrin repeat protein